MGGWVEGWVGVGCLGGGLVDARKKSGYTHTRLTQRCRSGLTIPPGVETYQGNDLTTTRQGTLVHSHLSLLNHCGLILA